MQVESVAQASKAKTRNHRDTALIRKMMNMQLPLVKINLTLVYLFVLIKNMLFHKKFYFDIKILNAIL